MDKNAIWDRTPPHLHINCSLHVWGRVQGSQIFKRNSVISILSKVMAFLVISLSPWSPHCPHHPHVVPVIPIAPRRFPCGPHGCGLHGLHCLHPMLSPWSPCRPCVIPMSSLCRPHHSHIVPIASRRSPWLWSPWSPWSPPHVVPMVPIIPMSSPSSPCHLKGHHIIPNPPDTHFTHPHPPGGWGVPNQ